MPANCLRNGKYVFAQQAITCLGTMPTVTVGRGRTYVTYASLSPNQTWDVGVAVFDAKLRPLWRGRIGPAGDEAGGPVLAHFGRRRANRRALGLLLRHDRRLRRGSTRGFSVPARGTAGTGPQPVRVARQPENAFVLWADAIRAGFGDSIAYGSYPGVAAAEGVAHPMWIDARDRAALTRRSSPPAFPPHRFRLRRASRLARASATGRERRCTRVPPAARMNP